jgi:hypothetical protein
VSDPEVVFVYVSPPSIEAKSALLFGYLIITTPDPPGFPGL